MKRAIIYQLLPRLFGNSNPSPTLNGSKSENGCGTFAHINDAAISAIKDLGATHIWLTGIIRHATQTDYTPFGIPGAHPDTVKGKAGSPYAVTDYFDVDPDLATEVNNRMNELGDCIARIHNGGLQVVIDFIPNHTARQYSSIEGKKTGRDLGEGDFTHEYFHPRNHYYYLPDTKLALPTPPGDSPYQEVPAKATGNDCFSPNPSVTDWYETVKLNYGVHYPSGQRYFDPVPATWHYMLEVLLFWCKKGVDGFRCDMVEMVPVEFWCWVIPQVKTINPNLIWIAEVYDPNRYMEFLSPEGFDFLYDKVGMYDSIRELIEGQGNTRNITSIWQQQEGFGHRMLRFLENHDEQRIASTFVGGTGKKAISGFAVLALSGMGPIMVYAGQEFGEQANGAEGFSGDDGKTSIFDYSTVPVLVKWNNYGFWNDQQLSAAEKSLRNCYQTILSLAKNELCFSQGSFFDLQYANLNNAQYPAHKMYAFLRYKHQDCALVVSSFYESDTWIRIIIPKEAWQATGLNPLGHYELRSLTEPGESLSCFAKATYDADGGTSGLVLELPAYGFKVFRIFAT